MPFVIAGQHMGKEAGYKNLIPLNQRTTEEKKKIQKMGGKQSGKVRAENKTFKELLKDALEVINTNASGEQKTCKEIIVINLVKDAMKGDKKATQMVAEMLGEYVVKTEVTGADGKPLIPENTLSIEDLDKEIARLQKKGE